jgi:hypothetical protein
MNPMRSPLFILVATFILTLIVAQEFSQDRGSVGRGKPLDLFGELLRQHPDLGAALAAADRGESAPLLSWLNGAPPLSRQALAKILAKAANPAAGLAEDDMSRRSDEAFYRWRERFATFVNIPTGNPTLDASLDNLIAYVSVAGTEQPTPADIARARGLLPRIEKNVTREPDHALYDTIGCVYFVLGDYTRAREAFANAVRLCEKETGTSEAGKIAAATLPLYRERLAVAVATDLRTVEQRADPATRPHLPRASLPSPPPAAPDAKPK